MSLPVHKQLGLSVKSLTPSCPGQLTPSWALEQGQLHGEQALKAAVCLLQAPCQTGPNTANTHGVPAACNEAQARPGMHAVDIAWSPQRLQGSDHGKPLGARVSCCS